MIRTIGILTCLFFLVYSNDYAFADDEAPSGVGAGVGSGCSENDSNYGGLGGNNCGPRRAVPSFNDPVEINANTCASSGGTWENGVCLEPVPQAAFCRQSGGVWNNGICTVTKTTVQTPPAKSESKPPPETAAKATPSKTQPEDLGNGMVRDASGRVMSREEYDAEQKQLRADTQAEATALREAAKKCTDAKRDAQSCCREPMTCLTGRENPEISGAVATLTGLIGTGVAMYAGQQQNPNDPGMQACKTLQYLGMGAGGLNGVLGGVCTTRKLSCDSTCSEIFKKSNELIAANCPTGQTGASGPCYDLKNARSIAQNAISECSYLNANIQQMGGQAISSLSGAGIASLCNQISGSSVGFANLDRPPVFTGDCSNPANASNPACVNCTGANAATNPLCNTTPPPTPGLGDGPGTGLAKANFGSKEAGANVNAAGLEGAGQQLPVTPAIAAEANKNSGVQGGGGGGLGAASTPANNDLGSPNQGVAGGPNADIMQGTSGGNGFSGYATSPQTGGGEGGYGGYGSGSSEYKAPGFNLAQYLPGGKKAVAGRGLAAAAVGKSAELGNIQDDIWFRQTKRFDKWCRGDRVKCGVL